MCDHQVKTTKGTNAYISKLICTKCSFKQTVKNTERIYLSPDDCPHDHMTKLKSTSTIVRHFCMGCRTVVDSQDRADYNEAVETAKKIETASSRIRETASKLAEDFPLSCDGGKSVVEASSLNPI